MIIIFTIYEITNKITGKKYIGQTSRHPKERFTEHCNTNRKSVLSLNIGLYGKENFILNILESDIMTEQEADQKERYYIEKEKSLFPNGYNKSTGGIKGKDLNEISKIKISELGKGILNSKCKKYIFQYDINGNFINKYGSSREAARALGNESNYRSILYCLNGKQKYAYGFTWKYED